MKCCICEQDIDVQRNEDGEVTWDQGHNAEPVKSGRCCSTCNYGVVLPVRMAGVFKGVASEELIPLCEEIQEFETRHRK